MNLVFGKYRTAFDYAPRAIEIANQIYGSSRLLMQKYKLIFTESEQMVQKYPLSS